MPEFRSDFLRIAQARGFVHQVSDPPALDALMAERRIVAYVGFDCTGRSLHVGHLLSVMLLRHFQRSGHRPIVLMGGGTTKVGDPSGKDEARKLLSEEEIASNMASIKRVFTNFLTFGDGPSDATMVNNAEWLDRLEYISFLRDIGRHFSVNRMLGMDSVKLRLERDQPLSFLEFNYMVLQAYDFLELARRYGCALQMGGSDQWGNIVNGIDLGRRVDGRTLFALTTPLITTSAGSKMGKTASGAVWLNGEMLAPYDYWQFWRNTHDADVGRFLRLFTDLPLDEIERLDSMKGNAINDAKIVLANEATALCHGRPAADAAAETARRTFVEGAAGEELPTIEVSRRNLESGSALIEFLNRIGLASSNSDARRKIRDGAIRVNDEVVTDEKRVLTVSDVNADGIIKLSHGRKRHAIMKVV
ncbi:MAG TPA: tyrosine--tRNA ligase [Alphaproteobacteria bacterium]|nr:tyrosine--tRNA ligase [Alphaproteobacteria bacterium]